MAGSCIISSLSRLSEMDKIAVVTDSTSDLPEDLAQLHRIHVVSNFMVIDGESVEDGRGMTREQFYNQLPEMKSLPTTATASSGTYEQLYRDLFQQGFSQIISIHASSNLSGIYNAASVAAQAFENRIHVIDSQFISLGLGFQAITAAEAAASQPLDKVLETIVDARRRIRVVALLDTLEFVRRSGRVSWARARLGEFFQIKPLIEVRAGKVFSLGETRTRRKGIERLTEILSGLSGLDRLAIIHTNAEAEAQAFLATIQSEIKHRPFCVNITTVIGTHTGPKALGFVAMVS
jgi:DegV family protein with EDD domain